MRAAASWAGRSTAGCWRFGNSRTAPSSTPWRGPLTGGSRADLLGQLDDDPRRTADVAEPVGVSVAQHVADQLRAAAPQAGEHLVDVVDEEGQMAQPRSVRGRVALT